MPNAFTSLQFSTALCCLCALGASGCSRAHGDAGRPESALADTPDAQAEFRVLRRAWFAGSSAEQLRLEPALRRYVARFPADPESDLVRILLAFDALGRGDAAEARTLLEALRKQPGAVHDFARVAQAALALHQGKSEAAWAMLEPLRGKIVDIDERRVFAELCLRAAMAAGHYDSALDAAETLLSEAAPDAEPRLESLLRDQFRAAPKAVLVASLARLDGTTYDPGAPTQGRTRLRKILREWLVTIAVHEKDVALARSLLDRAPSSLRTSEAGAALVGIAGGGASLPLISGRSLGLVLSLGSAELRRRSANLSAGLARGLGSGDSKTGSEAVHLLAEDDHGTALGTGEALRDLAAQGAALLVAGVEGPAADAAADFAEKNEIAVLLVQPPTNTHALRQHVFVLGESALSEQAILEAELSRRGVSQVKPIGRLGEPCDTLGNGNGSGRFPVQEWRREGVGALLVFGPAKCADDVVSELRRAAFAPLLALGLEAAEYLQAAEVPRGAFAVGAGRFPGALPRDSERNPALPAIDWYEALGHDAALLARAALSDFPDTRVDDARIVRELRARAERAVGSAEAELWTSDFRGFSREHALPRTLALVSSDTTPKSEP